MNRSDNREKHGSGPVTVEQTVARFIREKDRFLDLVRQFGSPVYVIEEEILKLRAAEFIAAFRACLPDVRAFFPVKANSHRLILETLSKAGMGMEVSSGHELELALAAGSKEIIFNGPAKTDEELNLAIRYNGAVTVIMDSFSELEKLESLAAQSGTNIRSGIRLSVKTGELWHKFGIPMEALAELTDQVRRCPHVRFAGIHFHTSWNMDPSAQVQTIMLLGNMLGKLPSETLRNLEFLDIGGGFWPPQGQWLPATQSAPADYEKAVTMQAPFHTTDPAAPISEFADRIGAAIREHIFPRLKCTIYTEPGRWICNDAAHILLTVLDRKGDMLAITDGGTNIVGWERFACEYFPIINLSRPAMTEMPFLVLGSLCTPHDLWGRSFFGRDIRVGDIILAPMQGAYTYSLRQPFIKPLRRTVFMPAGGRAFACEER